MLLDLKAERNFGSATKFFFKLLGISILIAIGCSILRSFLVELLVAGHYIEAQNSRLTLILENMLCLFVAHIGFLIVVAFKMLKVKNIPFNFKVVALIVSIVPLTFMPFTLGLLAYLIPTYFSTLPANVDTLEPNLAI